MKRENQNKCYRYFDNCAQKYLSNISSNHTSQTYVNHQSVCCLKLIAYLMPWRHSFGGFSYYLHLRHKDVGRYSVKTCNFPILLIEGEKLFYVKGIYSSKATYVTLCLSTPAESTPESSPVKICSLKSLPGETRLDFLPPQQYYITYLTPGKIPHK